MQAFPLHRKNAAFLQPRLQTNQILQPLQLLLEGFLLSYRRNPHAAINQAPPVLFLQCHLRTRLDLLKSEVEIQVLEEQFDQAFHHDQHVKNRNVSCFGQHVMVRNFCSSPTWLSGKVVKVLVQFPTYFRLETLFHARCPH